MSKNRTLSIILLTALGFASSKTDWIQSGELYYSPNKIIVKLNSEIAPKLGMEPALDLVSRSTLLIELSNFGVIESFTPVFKFHTEFKN